VLFRGLLERGIYIAPSQYECFFPSLAHDDDVIDETIEAVSDVCETESGSGDSGNG
jgi:glutamate-1-semialdehyde 2,1-aminomutase